MQYTESKLNWIIEQVESADVHICSSCGDETLTRECEHCGYDESENENVHNPTL